MIDHLDLAEAAEMEVLVTWGRCDYVQVQDSFCCREQWKQIPAVALELED